MTEIALPSGTQTTAAAAASQARVRARYRAETRFKFYGLAAIAIAAVFLVVVLADIVVKGLPAFTQHWVRINVQVDPAEVDPQGTKKPEVIRSGDFAVLSRNALRAIFPDVTERADRRLLDGLLSSGAADNLRERVVADPSLIGKTIPVSLLLSDDADLYLKGQSTAIGRQAGRGVATPSATSGDVVITSTVADFAGELAGTKRVLSDLARAGRLEAERLRQSMRSLEAARASIAQGLADARAANDAPRIATFEARVKDYTGDIDSLNGKINDLETQAATRQARFNNTAGEENLDSSLPTLLIAINDGLVKVTRITANQVSGTALVPLQSTAAAAAGKWETVTYLTPEANRRVTDREVAWLEALRKRGASERNFNWGFFTSGDSREPELAGIRGALVGSALTLFVTLILCLPIGVAAAIYLEEFAPKNRLTEIVEVNINNLAAVPSIVFGLLGLAVFLNFIGFPRSAPLVGGLVLALLVLPTIIIASRAALKSVPPSIKEAALGVGASQQQAIFHHVLPLAMPGIMTGTIIGMAHALGETAPLLMIGMVAFIVETPSSISDAATVLPVQIFLWSDLPEIAFQAKTAAAIMVLLAFLFVMNGTAIILRKRFERRW